MTHHHEVVRCPLSAGSPDRTVYGRPEADGGPLVRLTEFSVARKEPVVRAVRGMNVFMVHCDSILDPSTGYISVRRDMAQAVAEKKLP